MAADTTDTREMLENAARAEGRQIRWMTHTVPGREPEEFSACWNPLTDDGDALRLAVKLRIDLEFDPLMDCVEAYQQRLDSDGTFCATESLTADAAAAVRLAVVRVAAQIGKEMSRG